MRSLLALLVCTGLIAWAHSTKHKYFGLRATEPSSMAKMPAPTMDANAGASVFHNATFRLPSLHSTYLRGVAAMRQDSAGSGLRFAPRVEETWQLQ